MRSTLLSSRSTHFFGLYNGVIPSGLRHICHYVISQVSLSRDDVVFAELEFQSHCNSVSLLAANCPTIRTWRLMVRPSVLDRAQLPGSQRGEVRVVELLCRNINTVAKHSTLDGFTVHEFHLEPRRRVCCREIHEHCVRLGGRTV